MLTSPQGGHQPLRPGRPSKHRLGQVGRLGAAPDPSESGQLHCTAPRSGGAGRTWKKSMYHDFSSWAGWRRAELGQGGVRG